jgi:alpha-beta hydrolase superfamily lysophospholipase
VLLFHQTNRTRKAWDDVAGQPAAAGINTLTVDNRGHGESGGKYDNWTDPNWKEARKQYWPGDLDTAFQYLLSQPGINRDVIGVGGAGYSASTTRADSEQSPKVALLPAAAQSLIELD